MKKANSNNPKTRRAIRVRKSIVGPNFYPRLSVFRSNKHLYAQIIDDQKRVTLVGVSDKDPKKPLTPEEIGGKIAKLALKKKISQVRFDRGYFAFHGKIALLAAGAKKNGLIF